MKTNFVLVDCENVTSPALSSLKDEQFRVWIFLGPNNTKLKKEVVLGMQLLQDRLKFVDMAGSGNNALDFKRKAARPVRLKTLSNTIRSVCGNELSDSKVTSLIKSLGKLNYLKVDGTKVQLTQRFD